jgi:hypothetical protein
VGVASAIPIASWGCTVLEAAVIPNVWKMANVLPTNTAAVAVNAWNAMKNSPPLSQFISQMPLINQTYMFQNRISPNLKKNVKKILIVPAV